MPMASSTGYYAVRIGRAPGIYRSWADCEAHIKGFPNAVFKKFSSETQANEFMNVNLSTIRPSAARDTAPVASPSTVSVPPVALAPTPEDEKDCDVVYCDGACKGNGQPGSVAGIGVWWGHGDPRNISERCPGDQTNNRAELISIVRILETTPHLTRRLLIKTDSNYSIQCVTAWIFKWMRNGFLAADGKPVKNRALIKYLAALLHVRRKTSQTVEFKHVRGHVGIEGNEAADQLANMGATNPTLPERDWEQLEERALQNLKPVEPIEVVDNDLKAYADALLSKDELAESANTRVGDVTLHNQRVPHSGKGTRAFVSPVLSPPANVSVSKSKLTSNGPATTMQSVGPSQKASMNKEELETLASYLLCDDELSTLGRNGEFDSDF